jgi:hypothetical protein
MLDQQDLIYVLGVAGLVTAPYWLGPYKHWKNSKNRPHATPEFWVAGERNPVPASAKAHFDATASRVAHEGFKPLPAIGAAQGPVTMHLQFFVHDQHPERITAASIEAFGPASFKRLGLGVQTLHKDGRDWETTNASTARTLSPELQRIFRVPGVSDPVVMLRLHRQFVREMTKSPAVRRDESDPLQIQQRVERRSTDKMVQSGWYYREKGHTLPTLKGACLGIWINLPPWKNIVESRDRDRRARYARATRT